MAAWHDEALHAAPLTATLACHWRRGVCEDTPCQITNSTTLLVNDVNSCFSFEQASGTIPAYSIPTMQCAATITVVATGLGAGLTPDAFATIVFRAVDTSSGLLSAWTQFPVVVECSSDDGLVRNTWSDGSVCIECPFGGFCADGVTTPIAASGFWLLPGTNTTFLLCSPSEAWCAPRPRICLACTC